MLLSPALLQAQESTTEQGLFALEEVIVTAQKRSQNLQDVPMTVNVVSGEQIEALRLFDIRELSTVTPGLTLENVNGSEATIALRGVPFNPNTGAPDAVDIYLNEASFQADAAFLALYDVAQIEVLRGPQGSLRGRTSPAGAITIATRKPDFDEADGYAQLSASDGELINVQGGVGLPIIADKFAVRVAGLLDDDGELDQVYNVNTGQHNRRRVESGRITFAIRPLENLDITAMYQHITAETRLARQVIGEGSALTGNGRLTAEDRIAVAEVSPIYRKESDVGVVHADLELNGMAVNYIGSWQSNPAHNRTDGDGADAVPGYSNINRIDSEQKLVTQELRLQSTQEGFWNWMFGAYYERVRTHTTVQQSNDSFVFPNPTPVFSIGVGVDIPASADKLAFFTANEFALTDRVSLEAGLRYNRLKTSRQSTLAITIPGIPIPPFPTIAPENTRVRENPFTGNAALSYEFNPDVTGYISYGRSFRPGNPAVGLTASLSQELLVSGSETSSQIETGMKTVLADGRVRLNVAAFYQKFDGFISNSDAVYYRDPGTGDVEDTFAFNFNGDATIRGAEVQLETSPAEQFTLGVNAAYAKGRFDDALVPCNDFNQDGVPDAVGTPTVTPGQDVSRCRSNGRIAENPDFSLSVLTSFTQPIGSLSAFVNASFSWRPEFTSQTIAGYRYDSQELLNLIAGVRTADERWEVSLWAKNLFDQTRITRFSDSNALQGDFDSGYRLAATTLPRELGLTVKFNY